MRVQCPQCSTVLNVDEKQIPAAGAKIKCANCETLFRIERPKPSKPKVESPSDDLFGSPGATPDGSFADNFDFDQPPDFLDHDGADAEDLFGNSADLDDQSGVQEDLTPTMVFDASAESKRDLKKGGQPTAESEPGVEAEPDPEAHLYPDFDWPDEDEAPPKPAEKPKPKLDLSDNLLDQLAFEPGLDERQGNELLSKYIPNEAHEKNRERTQKLRRIITFVVLVSLLTVFGGYAAFNIDRIASFPFDRFWSELAQLLGAEPEAKAKKLGEIQSKLGGHEVVDTLKGERLLVLDGLTINATGKTASFIAVDVQLLDESGGVITATTVYAGNKLSRVQLRTFGFDRAREMHDRDYGANLSNFNVKDGGRLPFQAAFKPVVSFNKAVATARVTTGKAFQDEQ